ncbi:glycoside hydrolase [Lichtheimia hyalospora FSU 10163]|nr:glycoside hydrolase [Lichtheimia hyalospora FSU 10163]
MPVEREESTSLHVFLGCLCNKNLWFYEAQRSGKLPSDNRVPWRHDSALNDGRDNDVNLTGGYYDAGNYMKFTVPLAHTLTLISWGAIEWSEGYEKANQTRYLHDMLRWGTDWLIKAHPSDSVLFVQVADGDIDNDYWGPDTGIATPRPSYYVDYDNPGTDAAALTAAAFASVSLVFRDSDSNYTDTLVSHAKTVYEFAEAGTPWQVYSDAVTEADEYYGMGNYTSQLVYGALWLYRATGDTKYRDKASRYYDQFQLASTRIAIMDWSDATGSVYVLGAAIDNTTTKYNEAAAKYLDTLIPNDDSSNSDDPCTYTDGGLLWCGSASSSNSLVPANDIAFLSVMYDHTVNGQVGKYTQFAMKQLDYVLGNNPMFTPYVCGVHMNSPKNPHHAGASGGTDIANIDKDSGNSHVLYGAVVGGPDQKDRFFDERSDYIQNEVALDYNAPFQSLVAYQLMTDAQDPPYVNITTPRPAVSRDGDGSSNFPSWAIAVIVVVAYYHSFYFCIIQQGHGTCSVL